MIKQIFYPVATLMNSEEVFKFYSSEKFSQPEIDHCNWFILTCMT